MRFGVGVAVGNTSSMVDWRGLGDCAIAHRPIQEIMIIAESNVQLAIVYISIIRVCS